MSRADVAGDERRPDHAAVRVHHQADLVGPPAQPGRGAPRRRQHRDLGDRLVRELADRPDVDAEEEVAHRAVGDDHRLVDLVPVDAVLAVEVAQLVVEGPAQGQQHRAREVLLVRDAGHDVAAAEALRVLERGAGRSACPVSRSMSWTTTVVVPMSMARPRTCARAQVDRLAGVADGELVGGDDRVEPDVRLVRRPEDAHPAADDRRTRRRWSGPRSGPGTRAGTGPSGRPRARCAARARSPPCADLDDALPAAPGPPARRGHRGRDLVGVVEQGASPRPAVDARSRG